MKKKNVFFLVLCFMMLFAVPVMAGTDSDSRVCVNPLYANENIKLSQEVEEIEPSEENVGASSSVPYYSTATKAGAYLKPKMIARTRAWNFKTYSTNGNWETVLMNVVYKASAASDTTAANAGDYIRWNFYQFESYYAPADMRTAASGGGYYYHFYGVATYMSTGAQETWVNTKVNSLMSSLGITSMNTEYDIVKTVYDYITSHVTYDYTNLYNDSYLGKYSAYNALKYGTAICQGYANLMYRMLRQAGLSCRFIGGFSSGEGHAWNIVRIEGKYYNLDSTWDSSAYDGVYQYFLKGGTTSQFPDHKRDPEFATSAFNSAYPMSTTAYTGTSSKVVSYTITYHLNGGTNNSTNPSSYFQKGVTLQDPARSGYTFAGWFTNSGLTNGITKISKTGAKNYHLYAKWTKVTVGATKISFYSSDSVGLRVHFTKVSKADGYQIAYSHSSTFESGTVKYAYAISEATAKLIKVTDASQRYYVQVRAYRLDSTESKVYGAKSGKVSGFAVKYVLNGGTNDSLNPYYHLLRKITLASPAKEGYQFIGWYSDSNYKNKVTTINRLDKKNITLYAKWKKIS